MGIFRASRLFRGAVVFALLAVCSLNLATMLWEGFHRHVEAAKAEKAVQVQAIAVPGAQETCHHHPQGCPQGCFCPKTSSHIGAESRAAETGVLREPVLVNCTEESAASSSPHFSVFLPDPVWEMLQALEAIGLLKPVDPRGLPNPFRDPPQKIPIA